jgi:CRISP-associated protein Cas1
MKIADISLDNCYLHLYHGFLEIKLADNQARRTPVDDLDCLIVSGNAITYSHSLIQRLCQENIPMIICGKNYLPCGMLLNLQGNYEQMGRLHEQIDVSKPFKKRLWQKIIKLKITNQQKVLEFNGMQGNDFKILSERVKSGDPENVEGIAARKYWQRLFGKTFRRNFELPGINALLNFGYAILRSTLCRYVVATGLNPALGLHHHNKLNPWCLADDLIEPYRPFIDLKVKKLVQYGNDKVTPITKKELAGSFDIKFDFENSSSPLHLCLKNSVSSLWNSIKEKENLLEYPDFDPERI